MSPKENALAVTSDEGAIPIYTETTRAFCQTGDFPQGGHKAPTAPLSGIDIERRRALVRIGPGAGWFICVLAASLIPAIAVVFLICCAVALARACRGAGDGGRT
jgi:hypothetical protein